MEYETNLYFGYGSNLNRADWANACEAEGIDPAELEPLYPAYLPDVALSFNYFSDSRRGGVLGLVDAVGCLVSGYVFRATTRAWKLLDKKEGHPVAYRRITMTALTHDGRHVDVETYRVNPAQERRFVEPLSEYLAICLTGRKDLHLETESLIAAAHDKAPQPVDSLFAYGTIMRGESRFSIVAAHGLHCALMADTLGRLVLGPHYPGFLPEGMNRAYGDYFRSKNIAGLLASLDEIEGFLGFGKQGSLFRRSLCKAHVGDGRERLAWVYHICDTSLPGMPKPDWRYERGLYFDFRSEVVRAHAGACEDFYLDLARSCYHFSGKPDSELPIYDHAKVCEELDREQLSELELAKVSGCWAALCD